MVTQVHVCTPRYWGCPLCGQLWAMSRHCPGAHETLILGPICDFTTEEMEEMEEELRDQAGRPDANHGEVVVMLADSGIIDFVDPGTLEDDVRWSTWTT